jgi:hypothetical protein
VTRVLPRFNIAEIDVEREAKETAARFAEFRIIKLGLDAWEEVTRANSFESWKKIGAALLVGKKRALAITRANAPWGQRYCSEFNRWASEHGFDRMPSPTRSVAITLAEHEAEITAWRNGLPEKQRRRLINPQSVVKRWRAATQPRDKPPTGFKRTDQATLVSDAMAAWRRFVSCVEALPPDQSASLKATAAEFLGRDVGGRVVV